MPPPLRYPSAPLARVHVPRPGVCPVMEAVGSLWPCATDRSSHSDPSWHLTLNKDPLKSRMSDSLDRGSACPPPLPHRSSTAWNRLCSRVYVSCSHQTTLPIRSAKHHSLSFGLCGSFGSSSDWECNRPTPNHIAINIHHAPHSVPRCVRVCGARIPPPLPLHLIFAVPHCLRWF